MINTKTKKIGLALGSGASRGLTHIGVLKAIDELGIKIDYISGCSIGALIGGAYAMGMKVQEIEKIALQTDWKLMAKIFSPVISLSSLVSDKYLLEFLNTYFEGQTFNSLQIPFSAIATDIETGEMVVIKDGYLSTAIRASISLPLVFSPIQYASHRLVDGGLVNPVPVDVVNANNMDKIIAVKLRGFSSADYFNNGLNNVSYDRKTLKKLSLNDKIEYFIKHPLDFINGKDPTKKKLKYGTILYQMFIIAQTQMAELNIRNIKPDILIEPVTSKYKMFDFHKAEELIDIGYQTAKAKLNEYNLEVHKNRNLGMLGKDKDKNGK